MRGRAGLVLLVCLVGLAAGCAADPPSGARAVPVSITAAPVATASSASASLEGRLLAEARSFVFRARNETCLAVGTAFAAQGQIITNRHVAAGQGFGEQHHVRFDAPMLARKKPAGPTKPGLDFVGYEHGSIFSAEFRRAFEIAIVWQRHAFSLNRLDEERRDRARRQCPLQRSKIVERNLCAFGQKRTEARAEVLIAIQ